MSKYVVKAGMHCVGGEIRKVGDIVELANEPDPRHYERVIDKAPEAAGAPSGTGAEEAGEGARQKRGRKTKVIAPPPVEPPVAEVPAAEGQEK